MSKLYSSIIQQVEPGSLVTCYSDSSCFALLYEQVVNGQRSDVVIVPLAYPLIRARQTEHPLHKFSYNKNPYLLHDIVTWNIGRRPVYAVNLSKYYYNLFGIDHGFMYYIPQGYMAKLDRTMPGTIGDFDYSLSQKYSGKGSSNSDPMQRFLITQLSQTHFNNGYIFLKTGDRPRAQQEFNSAVNLSYTLTRKEKVNSLSVRTELERERPDEQYSAGKQVLSVDKILSYIPPLLERNRLNQAVVLARGAITVDPTSIPARLELAHIYEKLGDKNFTQIEYQNILLLDPHNQEALQKLSTTIE